MKAKSVQESWFSLLYSLQFSVADSIVLFNRLKERKEVSSSIFCCFVEGEPEFHVKGIHLQTKENEAFHWTNMRGQLLCYLRTLYALAAGSVIKGCGNRAKSQTKHLVELLLSCFSDTMLTLPSIYQHTKTNLLITLLRHHQPEAVVFCQAGNVKRISKTNFQIFKTSERLCLWEELDLLV